uniref:Triggering receptor expressed on myeloid cells-like 6 n=1 Tax=Mus spicilegus TaxID=10103 RepID=A0A8C6MRT4_MUSSI
MAWEPTYLLSPVLLLLLASGSWTQKPELLRAQEGENVSLTCWYDSLYHSDEKIWCKQIDNLCYLFVSKSAEKPRFLIQQSSRFNFFTVTMTKLKMSDSGIYYCGIAVNTRVIYLRSIHLVVSKASSTTTWRTTTLASTHSPVTNRSFPDSPMWKAIVAGVVVAVLLLLAFVILVILYLRKARGKALNVQNQCHPIYEDFSDQKEETTSFNQQTHSSEDTGTICYASLIHLNSINPQDSIYSNTQPYPKPSPDPLLTVEYASISRNRLGSSKPDYPRGEDQQLRAELPGQ